MEAACGAAYTNGRVAPTRGAYEACGTSVRASFLGFARERRAAVQGGERGGGRRRRGLSGNSNWTGGHPPPEHGLGARADRAGCARAGPTVA